VSEKGADHRADNDPNPLCRILQSFFYFFCFRSNSELLSPPPPDDPRSTIGIMSPSLRHLLIAKLLLCIISYAVAQPGEGGSFFNPPLGTDSSNNFNPVWIVGQTQHIQWTTTLSNFTIFLYQQVGLNSATQGPGLFSKGFALLLSVETNSSSCTSWP
jgi:hypothetical protein